MPCAMPRFRWPVGQAGSGVLAGPVLLVRGTELVGRGRVRFVAKGEPFELGFGVDDGIRVRRQVADEREVDAEPSGFWWIEPNDADANVIAFACSDAAGYMTGETIAIDGGLGAAVDHRQRRS